MTTPLRSTEPTAGVPSEPDVLTSVRDLVKYFPIRGGFGFRPKAFVKAVDHVSFDIKRGETLGLVGESGCGKTTTGRVLLKLIPPTSGEVLFEGENVFKVSNRRLKRLRRDMQIIFQDPFGSLDPRMTVGQIVAEGLKVHGVRNRGERRDRVAEALRQVGLRPEYARRYPHEFSGGQRQRIGIARALVLRPKLIVCDEPVSALDVSIQSQVLNLLQELQAQFNLTYLFIAHNLAVVRYISDRIGVMYLGKIVELADSEQIYQNPLHPYTQALISAIPEPDPTRKPKRIILHGDVPSPVNPPSGCRFRTRCPEAQPICGEVEPKFEDKGGGQYVACHFR